jgi:hypothetical protein
MGWNILRRKGLIGLAVGAVAAAAAWGTEAAPGPVRAEPQPIAAPTDMGAPVAFAPGTAADPAGPLPSLQGTRGVELYSSTFLTKMSSDGSWTATSRAAGTGCRGSWTAA